MSDAYDAFADRVCAGGILTDPWNEGLPRLSREPVVLSSILAREMGRAAETIAEVYQEMCGLVSDEPALLESFFGLTAFQQAMWLASEPRWHGIARADVFVTDEGLAFAELNCDTPTGEAEAVVLAEIASADHPDLVDPNARLEQRFGAMLDAVAARTLDRGRPRTVGLVYPTELTEDLSVIRLYRRWLEQRGWSVVLGSPYNLAPDDDGSLRLFQAPIGVMLRHYKTDWWGERASAWMDDQIPDAQPLGGALGLALNADVEGRLAVVNPFGAVVPQNKRSMAFMWERIHRFSPSAQDAIRRWVPLTARLEVLHAEQLLADKDGWVIKSDYGAEGDEVVIGRGVTEEVWRASLAVARPGRWIAQRYFQAVPAGRGAGADEIVNHGVFLVAGRAAGIYARRQAGATDHLAVSAPVLIEPS